MSRELFTKDIPTEPGMYYVRYREDSGVEAAFLSDRNLWFAFGKAGPIMWASPVYNQAVFGPRIPSPEALAERSVTDA